MNITGRSSTASEEPSLFYFSCGFCRWSSLSIDLKSTSPSLLIADAIKREKETFHHQKMSSLVELFQKEHKEMMKDKRQTGKFRRMYRAQTTQLNTPPPTTINDIEKKIQLKEDQIGFCHKKSSTPTFMHFSPEETSIDTNLIIDNVTNLEQRLLNLTIQPRDARLLQPRRKGLMTKRSKHCRKCDKLLVKPDLSASKADFKRLHMAKKSLFLPTLTVKRIAHNDTSSPSVISSVELELCIRNPTETGTFVTISQFNPDLSDWETKALPLEKVHIPGLLDIDKPQPNQNHPNATIAKFKALSVNAISWVLNLDAKVSSALPEIALDIVIEDEKDNPKIKMKYKALVKFTL
eukprot:TRINITY_DN735_c0_g1_i1.p1 TRINITY_DN735_c0_g1~~TRINITY_DN735_c0_g1_i1.p1  ORF type:complete len:350 (+),score=68.87 TRINITY_DN735_c0_g1_i1:298-1347(+)